MRIGIVGLGKMGEALARGLTEYSVRATTRTETSAMEATQRTGIPCGTSNADLADSCDVLILSVKPHQIAKVMEEMRPNLRPDHLIVSIAAAVTAEAIYEMAGRQGAVVRAMSNTPVLIHRGMTAVAKHVSASDLQLEFAMSLFRPLGEVAVVEEYLLDGVTGLSGCGPAYIYVIIEALSEAGVKVGLPRKTATLMAAQTLLGAAEMVLQRGEHPAALKDEVTTPAGCTVDGLMALEEGMLRATLIRAVVAATERSKTLGSPK